MEYKDNTGYFRMPFIVITLDVIEIAPFTRLSSAPLKHTNNWKRNSRSSKLILHLEAWEEKDRNKETTEENSKHSEIDKN